MPGVAVSDVTTYTASIVQEATTAFVNRADVTDKTPVLVPLKRCGSRCKEVDPTIVAEINVATAAAMDAGNNAAENPIPTNSLPCPMVSLQPSQLLHQQMVLPPTIRLM